jgi:hypothetical protein
LAANGKAFTSNFVEQKDLNVRREIQYGSAE